MTTNAYFSTCSACNRVNVINALSLPQAFCSCGNQIYPHHERVKYDKDDFYCQTHNQLEPRTEK